MPPDAREPVTFETLADIDVGALRAAVLEAAVELDVFTAIGSGRRTLPELVEAVGADQRALAVLLDALCGLGLLAKSAAGYTLEDAALAFLARGGEAFRGEVILRMSAARRQLGTVVRSGRPVADLVSPSRADFWAQFTSQRLVTWPQEVEEEVAMWRGLGVTPVRSPGVRILDLACGSGVRTFGLARADPQARIVAVDSASVLDVAREVARRMGVEDRVTFRAGDVRTVDLGSGEHDVALLSYLLYFFAPDDAVRLLERVWGALRPGGRVVVRAAIPDEDRSSPADALLDAVELLLWVPQSRVYTTSEYRDLLARAGFEHVARHGDQVVTGVRPG